MLLRAHENIPAVSFYHQLLGVSNRLEKSVEKLSSGLRVNRAADNAAGLTISEKLRRQVCGFARATMNAQNGISMIQSAEGALNETHSGLYRMRELAAQVSNGKLTSHDRFEIQREVVQLRDDIYPSRIAFKAEFNTKKLLDGSQNAAISTSSAYARGLVTENIPEDSEYQVSLALLPGGSAQLQTAQIFSLRDSNELAQGQIMLQSIVQLYDANRVFLLEEPQTITHNGNSRMPELLIDDNFVDSSKDEYFMARGFLSHQPGIVSGEVSTLRIGAGQNSVLVTLCVDMSGAPDVAASSDMANFEELTMIRLPRFLLNIPNLARFMTSLNLPSTACVARNSLAVSESRIGDADVALEIIKFTSHQIISPLDSFKVGPANIVPKEVLQLLT